MTNLDALEQRVKVTLDPWGKTETLRTDLLSLITELKLARSVVEAAHKAVKEAIALDSYKGEGRWSFTGISNYDLMIGAYFQDLRTKLKEYEASLG
jgi:hypothetical protein